MHKYKEEPEILAFTPMDLTNKRIHVLLNELNRRQFNAWDSKTIKDIEAYYNALKILFLEVEPLLDRDEIERIKAKMKDAWNIYKEIITAKTISPTVLIFFLNKLDKINEAIRISMQMHEYFFKKGAKKAGLDGILERLLPKYYCGQCNNEINAEWNFCPNCGNKLKDEKGELIKEAVVKKD
jgi:NADH pyrophosphatase NudC (nudix superfamily)